MSEEIVKAEKAGANHCAIQVIYGLPRNEDNPYQLGSDLYEAFHRGYEIEAAIRGIG